VYWYIHNLQLTDDKLPP